MPNLTYAFDPTAPADVAATTAALQRLIDDVHHEGGGRVTIPPGLHTAAPIRLRSHVELHLAEGATLRFSDRRDDFPLVETDWEGEPAIRCASPLHAIDATDVAITGTGTIDGTGEAWRPVKRFKVTPEHWLRLIEQPGSVHDGEIWWPTQAALEGVTLAPQLRRDDAPIDQYTAIRDFLRPNLLQFTRCRRVRFEGVTFRNSPAWCLHLLLCEGVTIHDVNVYNPHFAQNGDALDLDSCRNVIVSHSTFDAGDDAICIKSGRDEAGRRRGVPSENIDVRNCRVLHGHGGVTIGSEMSGGVRNVTVANCDFRGTDVGLRFKSTRGRGGTVEHVDVRNVTMSGITREAISINCFYAVPADAPPQPFDETTPTFRALRFTNVTCDGAGQAIEVRGLPERAVQDVTFEAVSICAKRGVELVDADAITLRDVRLRIAEGDAIRARRVTRLRCDNVEAAD